MKAKKIILLFLLVAACGPEVKFVKPLPAGKRNLAEIPANYQGSFRSIADSSVLTIDRLFIISNETDYRRMTKEQLFQEMDTVIDHDTLVWITPAWCVEVNLLGDSAEYISKQSDTLFRKEGSNCIRKYRDYLFLNKQTADNYWTIQIMKMLNDSLYFDGLVSAAEIDSIRIITDIKTIADTAENKIQAYHLNPSNTELNTILKRKHISPVYVKYHSKK
jgi:hypothetical protein